MSLQEISKLDNEQECSSCMFIDDETMAKLFSLEAGMYVSTYFGIQSLNQLKLTLCNAIVNHRFNTCEFLIVFLFIKIFKSYSIIVKNREEFCGVNLIKVSGRIVKSFVDDFYWKYIFV